MGRSGSGGLLAVMAGLHGRVLHGCGGETVLTHKLGALPGEAGGLLRATGGACNPGRGSVSGALVAPMFLFT